MVFSVSHIPISVHVTLLLYQCICKIMSAVSRQISYSVDFNLLTKLITMARAKLKGITIVIPFGITM